MRMDATARGCERRTTKKYIGIFNVPNIQNLVLPKIKRNIHSVFRCSKWFTLATLWISRYFLVVLRAHSSLHRDISSVVERETTNRGYAWVRVLIVVLSSLIVIMHSSYFKYWFLSWVLLLNFYFHSFSFFFRPNVAI